ncbi:E3 ubiquitin/ISG15 ligase TRIM25-like [Ranitomeya imitator]|uniref:E3 ubiquitin/ISG15 ligase TRIM25-like n=1 Tax=Ranitomeya imitator TaxID=111125 RepID=UPI0037E7B744
MYKNITTIILLLCTIGNELTCCICLDLYTGPVTLSYGRSFCMECIRDTFETQEGYGLYSCPECRANFETRPFLQKSLRLSNIVETLRMTKAENSRAIHCSHCVHSIVPAIKTCLNCEVSLCAVHVKVHNTSLDHVLMEPTTFSKDRKCSKHKKVLEYYCTDDAICICVSCRLDGDHRGHLVETIQEASEKKRDGELRPILEKLSSRRKLMEKIQALREHKQEIHDKAVNLTERTRGLFSQITEQVKALEKEVLGEIAKQNKLLSLSVSDLIHQVEIQKETLSAQILEVEQFCSHADPLTVLREKTPYYDLTAGNYPQPHVRNLDEGPVSLILHRGLGHVANVLFEGAKRQIPRTIETCNVMLDLHTAHHKILLSGDRTCASSSPPISLNYADHPERFSSRQVLSSSRFSSGKHYWQVDLSKAQRWIIRGGLWQHREEG